MGQALYRKYRSKTLSEIIGQEHITETLASALKSGRVSHAYLFTGPRGVGKTSIARILAHEINGIPYEDDRLHMDIIEIDAASNRRIDEIRELRDRVAIAPSSAKYKVYIIDEVHMLTKEAFNALLKTLEEPPAHVIFILATTDAHKLPATIVSRTQRYTFKPVTPEKVVEHLRYIATSEGIAIDDDALKLLAAHGEGSFRDSISMLDQAGSHGNALTLSFLQQLLGIPPMDGVNDIIAVLQAHDGPAVATSLNRLYDQGFQAAAIAKALGQTLRSELLNGASSLNGEQLLTLLARLLEVPASHEPERLLEIVLLTSAGAASIVASVKHTAPTKPPVVVVPSNTAIPAKAQPVEISKPQAKVAAKPVATELATEDVVVQPVPTVQLASIVDAAIWPDVLSALKQKYNTLYGVVRMAVPTFEGEHLELAFGFAFHQKRLTDPKNKKILADIIYDLSGQAIQITCVVRKDNPLASMPAAATSTQAAPDISAISDIFGGGEII